MQFTALKCHYQFYSCMVLTQNYRNIVRRDFRFAKSSAISVVHNVRPAGHIRPTTGPYVASVSNTKVTKLSLVAQFEFHKNSTLSQQTTVLSSTWHLQPHCKDVAATVTLICPLWSLKNHQYCSNVRLSWVSLLALCVCLCVFFLV